MTSSQQWNSQEYLKHANFVPQLGNSVLELLNPQPGESILDLGCGDGELTLKIAGICQVIGVDSSDSMIEQAKRRGLTAQVMDGQKLYFKDKFDAVFSNAALHWMKDYQAVLSGVYHSLKENGRFVGEFGGYGNIHYLLSAIKHTYLQNPDFGNLEIPWYFPSADQYKLALTQAGFSCQYIELIQRPTPLNSGVRKWLEIFSDFAIRQLNASQKIQFLNECEDYLRDKIYSESQGWVADYVRLRFSAIK